MNINKLYSLIVTASILTLATLGVSVATADFGPNPARQAAFKTCAAENGVTLPPTGAPDPAKHEAMKACMSKAGFPMHHHHHKHWEKIKACVEGKGVQLPAFTPGQKPELTADQQAAIQSCKADLKAEWQAKRSAAGTAATTQ